MHAELDSIRNWVIALFVLHGFAVFFFFIFIVRVEYLLVQIRHNTTDFSQEE